MKKNNIRSVLEQIRDTSELDPDIPLSDLLSLEKRWEVLNGWAHKRDIFLLSTLDKWKAFRQEEMTMIAWIDAKDANLQELDVPINLTDENAVQERLHTLRVSVDGNVPTGFDSLITSLLKHDCSSISNSTAKYKIGLYSGPPN